MDQLKLPLNMSITGSTLSGKTYLVNKLLHQLKTQWDVLVILSPTIKLSGDFEDFEENTNPKNGKKVIYKFDNSKDFKTVLDDIIEQQEQIITLNGKKETPQVILLMDDMVGNSLLRYRGPIDKLSTKSRHLNLSLFVLVQRITAIPRTFRLNTRIFITFNVVNFSELERLLEDCVPKSLRNPLRIHINVIFNEPYNFLMINCFATRLKDRLWKNGTEPLYDKLLNDGKL